MWIMYGRPPVGLGESATDQMVCRRVMLAATILPVVGV